MKVAGKCLCGAIQFMVKPKNLEAHACHCGICRRWAGSPTLTIACDGPPEFKSPEMKELMSVYKSSEWGERTFCSKCGTTLFTNAPGFGYYGLSVGALEDGEQTGVCLHEELYIDKKPTFYDFGGDRPRLTEAEFLARMSGGDGEEGETSGDSSKGKND